MQAMIKKPILHDLQVFGTDSTLYSLLTFTIDVCSQVVQDQAVRDCQTKPGFVPRP